MANKTPGTTRGADLLVRGLQAAGVTRIFTLSGNHIMEVFDALLGSYSGDWLKVLRHVQVERFYVSRRYQVGTFTVNAQGQLTAAANVTITPAGIGAVSSVSGTANEITATGTSTVVLSLPTALTFTGKTVTGGTFNATAMQIGGVDVVTISGTQTLTNKTISGASNTLSNIGVASGGTGIYTYTIGDTLYASGATTLSKLALGTQGFVMTAGATGPVWSGISGGTF
jgi:hypothetical protein